MKSVSRHIICISIITLLVGVSYTSAIGVENKIPNANNQSLDDCGCNDGSNLDISKIKRQLNKLEINSKILLDLSKDLPIVKRRIEKLSYTLSNIKEELKNEPPNPILCIIFIGLFINTMILTSIIIRIIKLLPFIPDRIWDIFSNIVMVVTFEELVLLIFHCGIGPYEPSPFNLNNLIKERNDLSFRDFKSLKTYNLIND